MKLKRENKKVSKDMYYIINVAKKTNSGKLKRSDREKFNIDIQIMKKILLL